MENSEDPLAQFGLDAIDLRWTLKDIAAQRSWIINGAHVSKLIELKLGRNARRQTIPDNRRLEHGLG
jgi:hypothetical protein